MDDNLSLNKQTRDIQDKQIILDISALKGNKIFAVHKRTERIIAAIYLVSDLLSENDAIKIKLRNIGVDLMSYMFSPYVFFAIDNETFVSNYAIKMLEILSLLDIAFMSGIISEMNHRILMSEIQKAIEIAEI